MRSNRFSVSVQALCLKRALCLCAVLLCSSAFPLVMPSSANESNVMRDGIRLYHQNRFKEALVCFKTAREANPADISNLYYLGISALNSGEKPLALDVLTSVIATTLPENPFHANALIAVERNFKITPYSCVQKNESNYKSGTIVRWTAKSQPLKICITHGTTLPANCHKQNMNDEELRETASQLKRRDFISGLEIAANYAPEFRQYALDGLKQWEWAKQERLLDFVLIEKIEEADIVLFWSPILPGVGGVSNLPAAAMQPVIIQISVDNFHNTPNKVDALRSLVAHEFGHAFGLAHTAVPHSIMNTMETISESDSREFPKVSANDRATLRALYRAWPCQPSCPGVLLHSVSKGM